jgi:NOL1/NOP2/sun family putative RNA methylase
LTISVFRKKEKYAVVLLFLSKEPIVLISLPQQYLQRMEQMLGNEYAELEEEYSRPAIRGIRLNPLKCDEKALKAAFPYSLKPSPFSPLGYYLPPTAEKIGRLPMYHAGAFYVQEPSASAAVTILNPQPGEKILDLCAAPGGKSAQIASLLQGQGILWSNEYIRSRTGALLSNLERMGVRNAIVSCCHPEKLCRALGGYFDRVLVDAPCSGEGMFRKSTEAVRDWSPAHVSACSTRQLAILGSASQALKQDGILVYSTCTFSQEEDEKVVSNFLERNRGFELLDCGVHFGRPALLPQTRKIFPMDGGEGHFIAKMRRISPNPCRVQKWMPQAIASKKLLSSFWKENFRSMLPDYPEERQDRIFLIPRDFPEAGRLGILRAGLMVGTVRGDRIEPAHSLFTASKWAELRRVISFPHNSKEIAAFLHGEEINISENLHGYCGVAVDGIITGFGKCSSGRMKNHYPKGLRNL